MSNIAKWNTPGTLTSVLTTELNSLTTATMCTASAAYDNTTALDTFVDIELVLASVSPTAGAYLALYILESVDGTTYPTPSDADLRLQAGQLLGVFGLGVTASTAQRVVLRRIEIPPAKFKVKADNQCGATLASSGNTVKFLPYDINLNG